MVHRRPAEKEYSAGIVKALEGVRVLVVEDEDDGREMITEVLERAGAITVGAASAAEAFDALDRRVPDVILSDISMPGEDGYSFMRRVRARTAENGGQVPAAALTALLQPADKAAAFAAGFQLHVGKPVDPAALVENVCALALGHRAA
ncbi:MAG: Chemotaxis protein methyltransferase CheR [Labilithrix sp.]|nr:Chemotaxis protein methyltransferase CheR [Labilithrix sp.]